MSPPSSSYIFRTDADITTIGQAFQSEARTLNQELQKQNAITNLVTKQMVDDSLELLRLFGIPYVVSPSEAEAQCATLNQLGLCDGIITDDSDVWLFGSLLVLKNFFQHDRHVLSFKLKDIESLYGLDRQKLIAIALVTGSDYTNGIQGCGTVTAMEIISEFNRQDGLAAMKRFREFIDCVKANNNLLPASASNNPMRAKLSKIQALPESFPSQLVIDAYLEPKVDDSTEAFEWGKPDLDLLRKFATKMLSWPNKKVDDLVQPVLKRLNSTDKQTTLDRFCMVQSSTLINSSQEFQSKRVKAAISKILGAEPSTSTQTTPQTSLGHKKISPPKNIKQSKMANLTTNNKTRAKPSKTKVKTPVKTKLIKSKAAPGRQVIGNIKLSDDSDSN